MSEQSRDRSMSAGAWSRGGLVSLGVCPACGGRSTRDGEYVRMDDQQAMADLWRMRDCAACASIYLDPRPTPKSLGRAYEDYYTHVSEPSEASQATLVARAINGYLNRRFRLDRQPAAAWGWWLFRVSLPLRMKLDVFGRHVPRALCDAGGRILDVGCGNGAFVLRAQQMGLTAYGSEPDPKAVEVCRRQGLDVVKDDIFSSHWTASAFDWITMNHVIEHVEQPERFLARALDLLVPGGVLWLGLPNPEALGFRWFGVGWKGLHPPFHLLIPSQRVLRRWLEDAGFEDVVFVRRGAQSAGMWSETAGLSRREGLVRQLKFLPFVRLFGNVLASLGARWSEETIVVARRSAVRE
ncbi:MAG: class I SAM-dependent methyltransferase [Luteimonas sp.]